MGRAPQKITKLQSDDPVLNRIQDHLAQTVNPVLNNPALAMADWQLTEGPYPTPTSPQALLVQARTGPDKWSTVAYVDPATGNLSRAGDTTWTAVTYQNSWVDFGAPFVTGGFLKDACGFVHVRAIAKNGTATINTILFNLPIGYRPSADQIFPMGSNGAYAEIRVKSNGDVIFNTAVNPSGISIPGITFDTR